MRAVIGAWMLPLFLQASLNNKTFGFQSQFHFQYKYKKSFNSASLRSILTPKNNFSVNRSHKQADISFITFGSNIDGGNENSETNYKKGIENGRSIEEIANFLLNDINVQAWKQGQPDSQTLREDADYVKEIWDDSSIYDKTFHLSNSIFKYSIKKEELKDTVKKLVKFLQDGMIWKMVGTSHNVKENELTHDFDVLELKERVDHVFETYYGEEYGKEYYAPYLCFFQSSGMGKTKIMYELCKSYKNNPDEKISGRLILCRSFKDREEGKKEREIFDHSIDLQNQVHPYMEFNSIVKDVYRKLDILLDDKAEKLVLFFDEVHHLLKFGEYANKKKCEVMLFRIVRLWICRRRQTNQQIVAVFTGTTTELAEFIYINDLNIETETDTREMNPYSYHGMTARKLYKPFYITTTIGCLRFQNMDSLEQNDYFHAVPYGRPLFASMTSEELKKGEPYIASRMVQDDPNQLENSQLAWLSILGTRVQMGQTPFNLDLASGLVDRSYANLVSVTQDIKFLKQVQGIKICFPTDPVCARFAMCVMNEGWCMNLPDGSILNGREKTWWVGKMKELYSKNICIPEKGDFGEVMAALYFLFCADTLRYELDNDYRTFSVPLDKWIKLLSNGCKIKGKDDNTNKTTRTSSSESNCQVSFGAIQVCRNYIRAYDDSWSLLRDEAFLENIYKSGVGFYLFTGSGLIDLVFPLRVAVGENTYNYIPMLVSVKSHVYFSPSAAREECEQMKLKFEETKGSLGALCVLVIFGSSSQSDDGEYTLDSSSFENLMNGETVAQVLRVPTDDAFGLSEAFVDLTLNDEEMLEMRVSHSFLCAHREADSKKDSNSKDSIDDFAEKVLRTGVRKDDTIVTDTRNLLVGLDEIVKKTTPGKNE